MSWFKDLFKSYDDFEREARDRRYEENARRLQNGICPCGRNTSNCTYPSCESSSSAKSDD